MSTDKCKELCSHPKAISLNYRGYELYYMIVPSPDMSEWTIIAKANNVAVAGYSSTNLTECLDGLEEDLKQTLWKLCAS